MSFNVELNSAQLRVVSTFLVNIAAGIFLLLFTIHDLSVLTTSIAFATICLVLSIKIEEALINYD